VCEVRDDFRDEYPILDDAWYKTVGFRVAEACLEPETQGYIRAPIFLTSANKSGEEECHTIDEVNDIFRDNADTLKILPGKAGCLPASNVIQFVWTSNDLKYIRKNYPLK
jgi:tRNA A37 threonylcarbamoyladenosine synthetase subunit TsaC/SUA5/YrdC